MVPLQFQIPFDVPSLTTNIRNYNCNAVQSPCSVTFICLSSELASRRARKFEASNGTAQWGHTTYTWNVSAVIATVITVRQFADHCLCNTSINAASCVHTFSLSLSLLLYFSLCLSRSHDLSLLVSGDLLETRGGGRGELNDNPPKIVQRQMIIPLICSPLSRILIRRNFILGKRYCFVNFYRILKMDSFFFF